MLKWQKLTKQEIKNGPPEVSIFGEDKEPPTPAEIDDTIKAILDQRESEKKK